MITVFTLGSAQRLRGIGFTAAKVASYDCPSYNLIELISSLWEGVYISTGGATDEEVSLAVKAARATKDLTILHCITRYPTPLDDARMARIRALRAIHPSVGYSDHSSWQDGLFLAKVSLALGVSVVERHFTVLDRQLTKDGPVSILPEELRELVAFARLSPAEQDELLERSYPDWRSVVDGESVDESGRDEEQLNIDYYRGRVANDVPEEEHHVATDDVESLNKFDGKAER